MSGHETACLPLSPWQSSQDGFPFLEEWDRMSGGSGSIGGMNWDDLQPFLAVARTGSLSEAARRLGTSPSTVGRRLDALEAAIGAKLFDRRPDGYSLTLRGQALLPAADRVEDEVRSLARAAAAAEGQPEGIVRIAMPELLGQYLIVPSFEALHAQHPGLRLEILADVRPLRLSRREADVLVRLARPSQGSYTVQRIGRIALGLYGAAPYLARRGSPKAAAELAGHALIGWDDELAYLPIAQWLDERAGDTPFAMRTTNMASQLAAAQVGLGLAVLPAFIGESTGLRRVLQDEPMLRLDVWLMVREELRKTARVAAVAEHIAGFFVAAKGLDPEDR